MTSRNLAKKDVSDLVEHLDAFVTANKYTSGIIVVFDENEKSIDGFFTFMSQEDAIKSLTAVKEYADSLLNNILSRPLTSPTKNTIQ